MAQKKFWGYSAMMLGVFFLALAIPLFDAMVPESIPQGGLLVNIVFLFMVVGAGLGLLAAAWYILGRRRND